ncbi:hypothetical protein G5I_10736 [Acromyrmex echinatior]|uniref:Endonuclease/exonuclease/phosphatase domain-containing protein n=1 Tax=Acromyrmex echinatior TaxID=103372 RepID=F4WXP6_ACREC|nr:hypothetical protein G5I_10736 [Acromyrmex echinatior]
MAGVSKVGKGKVDNKQHLLIKDKSKIEEVMKELKTVKKDLSENNKMVESLEDIRSLGKANSEGNDYDSEGRSVSSFGRKEDSSRVGSMIYEGDRNRRKRKGKMDQKFIKERLGVECNIAFSRINGTMIMVRVGSEKEIKGHDFVSLCETWLNEKGWDAVKDRIGELGEEDDGKDRCSKNKVIRNGGRDFVKRITKYGWHILNGRSRDNWEEKYTYVEIRDSSVIDYALVNDNICDRIVEFRIDARVNSNHMPLSLTLEEGTDMGLEENNAEEDRDEEDSVIKEEEIIVWNKETIENYNKNTKVINEEDMDKGKRNNKEEINMENRISNYLRIENMEWKRGDEIKTLFKLRCGNLEEKNKY